MRTQSFTSYTEALVHYQNRQPLLQCEYYMIIQDKSPVPCELFCPIVGFTLPQSLIKFSSDSSLLGYVKPELNFGSINIQFLADGVADPIKIFFDKNTLQGVNTQIPKSQRPSVTIFSKRWNKLLYRLSGCRLTYPEATPTINSGAPVVYTTTVSYDDIVEY